MTKTDVMAVLGALAQETRLDIFRMLVQRGPEGVPAGEIGERMKLPSPTLSFHLNHLKHSGLIASRRESRTVLYDAKVRTLDNAVEYLSQHCGSGAKQPLRDRNWKARAHGIPMRVLFLCTRNSARSVMAECAMNRWSGGRFRAFSAGSSPSRTIDPTTLQILEELEYETAELHSKNWDEFAGSDSPPLDFAFTLCDRAAAEVCPAWPGQPIRAHWGVSDPVAFIGDDAARREAFLKTYYQLEQRIRIFTSLPIETLERFALERWVTEIGKLNLAA